jgi:putative ABC transport system permease protein
MNIMPVTLTECEPGELAYGRQSGAKRHDILLQFLIESTTISVIGGCIGILVGILAAYSIGDLVAQAMQGGRDWGSMVQHTAIIRAFTFTASL